MDKIEQLKNKLESMNSDEIREYYQNQPMKKYDRLNYIYIQVAQLLDFMNVIDKNTNQLTTPSSKVTAGLSDKGIRPSQFLYEYVAQEISSFYTLAYNYIEKGVKLPQIPIYWDLLKDFRNSIPGHMDKEEKLKTTKEWFSKYESVDKLDINKIIQDFEEYYEECVDCLGDEV